MSQKRRERQYPLDQPPNGMVVEPALPNRNPMTPSQTSVNNSLAGSDNETLPPVRDAQGNPVPLTEFGGMDDYAEEPVPTEVRQAAANIPETGVLYNLAPFEQIAQLHAAGQTEEARKVYNSLNEQAKYVYNNARNMERFTAQEGARLADEFRKRQDERQKLAEDPVKQAQLAERQLKVADAQRVQNEYAARRKNALSTIDEILANKKEYEAIVGPWDGSVGGVLDSLGVNEGRQVKRAKMSRLLFGDILELTKFLRPTTEKDIELAQRNVPGRFQNWPVFEDYLNEKKSVLLANETALVNPASNLPISAKAPSSQEPNVYQQSQQNPAQQLRQSLESGDSVNITQPDGSVLTLKKVTNPDGTISWE